MSRAIPSMPRTSSWRAKARLHLNALKCDVTELGLRQRSLGTSLLALGVEE